MTEQDQAEREAAELFPCVWVKYYGVDPCPADTTPCHTCRVRPALAAKLRELYAEIERLKTGLETLDSARRLQFDYRSHAERLDAELAHWREAAASVGQADGHGWSEETKSLRAEIARLQSREQAYEFIQRTFDEREKALSEAYAEIAELKSGQHVADLMERIVQLQEDLEHTEWATKK